MKNFETRVYFVNVKDITVSRDIIPTHTLFNEDKFITLCENFGRVMTLDTFIESINVGSIFEKVDLTNVYIHYKLVEKNL